MESLPPALLDFISMFRPLVRTEVFDSFTYLLCGLLIGEAKHGTVRASVFAPAHYQPQRLSGLFCCHKLSRQALMAQINYHPQSGWFEDTPSKGVLCDRGPHRGHQVKRAPS